MCVKAQVSVLSAFCVILTLWARKAACEANLFETVSLKVLGLADDAQASSRTVDFIMANFGSVPYGSALAHDSHPPVPCQQRPSPGPRAVPCHACPSLEAGHPRERDVRSVKFHLPPDERQGFEFESN
jgi:hypothetical protein